MKPPFIKSEASGSFSNERLGYRATAWAKVRGPVLFLCSLELVAVLNCSVIATDVLTYHYDNARTGWNSSEQVLTPSNVNAVSFGLKFTLPVDGKVDAEPLCVSAAMVFSGSTSLGPHNLVLVATEHDSVYAFDADTASLYWHVSLLETGESPSDDRGCSQVTPEIGVTATPVIDRNLGANGTIFLVAMSKSGSTYHQRLHALDLGTGSEIPGSPVEIQASFPGSGPNNDGHGHVTFDPGAYKERSALLLLNGIVYTSWASHCDIAPYTSWIIGYQESGLAQVKVLNLNPNGFPASAFLPDGSGNSFWNSGAGPAADSSGNIYDLTANGPFEESLVDGFPSGGDYGDTFLKLSTAGPLNVSDYFTPFDQAIYAENDTDLGSGGTIVLPDMVDVNGLTRHLAIGAGKDQNIYLVDRDAMGKFIPTATSNSYVYQELASALPGGEWATAAYFNGAVYYGPVGGTLRRYTFSQARLNPAPAAATSTVFAYPGVTPSISSSGISNGIVWAYENATSGAAVLHAYDATSLVELYNSAQNPARDGFGAGNKFITPTICNGNVFVATTNSVGVFGLLNSAPAPNPSGVNQVFPTADLNGDGRSDLVFFNQLTKETAVWIMNGNTITSAVYLGTGPVNYRIVAVADLQQTGRPQIIWSNGSANYIAWSIAWSVDNTPTVTQNPFILPASYPILVCADIDGDGLLDVAQFNPANGALLIAKNNGSLSFTTQIAMTVGLGWELIGPADLNGTGHPQLVWRNGMTGQVGAWVFSTTQPFQLVQHPVFIAPSLAWRIRGIGKVDATPAQGLIWHNSQTGAVAFWKMSTNGSIIGTTLQSAGAPWQIVGDATVDASGANPEILWVNQQSGSIAVWRVNGLAVTGSIIYTPGTNWVVQPRAFGSPP